ncbi:hypothetical protein GCM10009716_04310 [Streptomyces sodiiphilus]|uniref:DNA-directed RNA polymerase specialized sigma24 family protein n=1 Tax=Streptomyces sodiiphilus TaxID=226217 RepID=A0ABN2NUB8_9ACTN
MPARNAPAGDHVRPGAPFEETDAADRPVGLEQAEAALIEHYPRLVRLGHLVLPPALGRERRVLTAHSVVQGALPRERRVGPQAVPQHLPDQRDGRRDGGDEAGYACLRLRVLRAALAAGRPPRIAGRELRRLPRPPRLLPRVLGLSLFPRSGGAEELALEQALSKVSAPARAAFALRRLEGLPASAATALLQASGVREEQARQAVRTADTVARDTGCESGPVPVPDPCSLQARPTDLLRRRQHTRAATAAGSALALVAALLLTLPGWERADGSGPAAGAAARAALDPQELHRADPRAWRKAARLDFSVWPARGTAAGDESLLRRALAVWAEPGQDVAVSATPGTATGPPPGPPHLLYAGESDGTTVVIWHDGLRLVRYAEPAGGPGPAALDFARTDGADAAGSAAVVLSRTDGNVRYLTAPWVTEAAVTDLRDPAGTSTGLAVAEDGVTAPYGSPAGQEGCERYPVLELSGTGDPGTAAASPLLADLGELLPARLTYGPPDTGTQDVPPGEARRQWARTACHLPSLTGGGVRAVNVWAFAEQVLPEEQGVAHWVCARAETWRGGGGRATAQIQVPGQEPGAPGAVAAGSQDGPQCGPRDPRVLAGVLWKAPSDTWYLLAAGSEQVTAITSAGGAEGRAEGRTLALPAEENAEVELTAHLADGGELGVLR